MSHHRSRDSLTRCQKEAKNANILVKKPDEAETAEMSGKPVWECGVSEFDWYYDSEEHCLLLAGEVSVSYGNAGSVSFGAGDYVVFPRGLSCIWRVTRPVKKHYIFK